jgi:ribosomal protein S18 acetylase RimI-like enzyme
MSSTTDAIAAIRRSSHVYVSQVADQTALTCGIAFTCPEHPDYYDGNHLREVTLHPGESMAEAFEEVEQFYHSQGLRCFRWVPAAGQPPEPIEAFLTQKGYQLTRQLAMAWQRDVEIPRNPAVKMLPARAMRRAFREIMLAKPVHDQPTREMLAEVANERLNEPQYDMFVAMLNDQPAGHGVLFQVGDIGRLEHIYVAPPFRRQGVGRTIIAHLLALSRRLALRITCLETQLDNTAAQDLYRQCGLEPAGTYVEFLSPEVRSANLPGIS